MPVGRKSLTHPGSLALVFKVSSYRWLKIEVYRLSVGDVGRVCMAYHDKLWAIGVEARPSR